MLGRFLASAHKAFYAFGQWWACDLSDDVATKAVYSRQAYDRFQADCRKKIAAARARHGRVREIERERTERLHSALGLRHGR